MTVEPYIFGRKIGKLATNAHGVIYFEYDPLFRESGLEISPVKLPLASTRLYSNPDHPGYYGGLPGVFRDSLPDKFGMRVIELYYEKRGIPPRELSTLQKLMFVGDKGMGAICYRPPEHMPEDEHLSEAIEISEFYRSAKKIVQGEEVEAISTMLQFMNSAASAGGARAKAIVGWNRETKHMVSGLGDSLPAGHAHWLLKFDSEDEKGVPVGFTRLEYVYMQMAKEAGIDIPEIELPHANDFAHYLIKRFDRVHGKRIHMHSYAGLMHLDYNIPGHSSYDDLMRATRRLTGSQKAVEEQFRRMVFNVVARNQDDHAKNFSFMMDESGTWSISPAYDITYAKGAHFTAQHQMSIRGKTDHFTKEDLVWLAENNSIKKKDSLEVIQRINEVVSTFPKRAQEIGLNKKITDMVERDLRLGLK